MSALGSDSVFVVSRIRNLRGRSQAVLVQANDGLRYVVKFAGGLPFNEGGGSELYRACKLQVPSWKPLLVTDGFLDRNPDCWIQRTEGRLRPDPGLYFGSRFLGGDGIRLLEILPGTSFKQLRNHESFWLAWMVDICAKHTGNRQAIFVEDAEGWFDAYFVNHGHLFGGSEWEQEQYFDASQYLDQRVYQCLCSQKRRNFPTIAGSIDVDQLWQRVEALPNDWKTETTLKRFAECLDRLSDDKLLQKILDTMMAVCQRTGEFEHNEGQYEQRSPGQVLCSGVQTASIGRRPATSRVNHPDCA